jgi:alkylhydroperoxidase family enzyme
MARIPYADTSNPAIAPLVEQITRERGKVLNLYRMLLHSGPVASGWLNLMTNIRTRCSLGADIREAVILRIAVINQAPYEFAQHIPFALKAGITQAQIDALEKGAEQIGIARLDAALAYTTQSTQNVRITEPCFADIRQHFNHTEIVELTATIGSYNMVSRLLEALQIDHD